MKAVLKSFMVYRKKILLALLNEFGSRIEKLSLQKLLFLYCNENRTKKYYEFLPYKYGAFSFAANTDLTSLKKAGYINETETHWKLTSKSSEEISLETVDYLAVAKLKNTFSKYNADALIKYTYQNFPYYAINSVIAKKILDAKEYTTIIEQKRRNITTELFTIGYEGKTVDSYFNMLLRNGIKLLCDVRRNAYSMKPGFSKSQLKTTCDSVGIVYKHYPELGIASESRKNLQTPDEFDVLFAKYTEETLPQTQTVQKMLLKDYEQYGNAALTCFEHKPEYCHRSRLAQSIVRLSNDSITISNLL